MGMKILSIEPKDIYVTIELGLHQIKKILIALDRAEIKYDSKEEPEVGEAVKYLREEFFVELDKVFENIKE